MRSSATDVRQHLLAEEADLVVPAVAPELQHDVRAARVAVLLDRGDAVRRASRRSACTCRGSSRSPSPWRRAGRPAPSPRPRVRARPSRCRRARAACRPSRGCSATCSRGTCRRSRAPRRGRRRGRLVDRGDDRAADVDVGADVLARVADERRRRDRGRQAAVGDLARQRLHLRRRRGDVDGRHVAGRVGLGAAAPARQPTTCRLRTRTARRRGRRARSSPRLAWGLASSRSASGCC